MNQPQLTRMSAAPRHGGTAARQAHNARHQRKRKGAKAGSASGKLCAGRRLIRARLRARRPRGELVGYPAGKLTGVPAG